MKIEIKTKQDRLDYLSQVNDELIGNESKISRLRLNSLLLKNLADVLGDQIRIDNLVIFCQTGRYPE